MECTNAVLEIVNRLQDKETLNPFSANGRVLAEDAISHVNIPRFPTSIYDGYAVKSSSEVNSQWTIVGRSLAGDNEMRWLRETSECVYVSTGARMPQDSDCVIPIEYCHVESNVMTLVQPRDLSTNFGVRTIGSDTVQGAVLVRAGSLIGAGELGLLEACQVEEVTVYRKLRIGIISTGAEVSSGQVGDANKGYLLGRLGYADLNKAVEISTAVHVDNFERLRSQIEGWDQDIIITTGSVSKGQTDVMKPVLESLNFDILFSQVKMKPGKPTTVGIHATKSKIVFALPGNPASCFVTFNLFALPAILKMIGRTDYLMTPTKVQLTSPETLLQPDPERPEYLRANAFLDPDGRMQAELVQGHQRSSRAASYVEQVNCLILVPPGTDPIFLPETVFEALILPGTCMQVRDMETTRSSGSISESMKAKAFDSLVSWLQVKKDVENIDLMNLAGFCRNCLSKWLRSGSEISLDEARNYVYGMPYDEWKSLYRKGEKREHAPRLAGVMSNPCASSITEPKKHSVRTVGHVITVSDRASKGIYNDESGPVAVRMLRESGVVSEVGSKVIVPDDQQEIARAVANGISRLEPTVVILTGGTGFTQRDVTPETVSALIEKPAPGLVHVLLKSFIENNPMHALTRPVIGSTGKTLIVTLPGHPSAVKDGLDCLIPLLPKILEDLNR